MPPRSRERPRLTVQSIGPYTFAVPEATRFRRRPESAVQWLHQVLLQVLIKIPVLTVSLTAWTLVCWTTRLIHPPSYRRFLGFVLPSIFQKLDHILQNPRQLLLQHVRGRVLDVGAGSGMYLRRLVCKAAVTHVVALEPLETLRRQLPQVVESTPDSVLHPFQITVSGKSLEAYAAQHHAASPAPPLFHWIILGNVLCEVPDVTAALVAANSLLAPGGFVFFSEHVASPVGTCKRRLQATVHPWWASISGGCHCHRDSLHAIEGMAEWEVCSWEFADLQVVGGPMVLGIARKVAAA
jgi:SAM-dependent methyltransferase